MPRPLLVATRRLAIALGSLWVAAASLRPTAAATPPVPRSAAPQSRRPCNAAWPSSPAPPTDSVASSRVPLAAQGAHVIVHGRNRARGDSLVAEIAAAGTRLSAILRGRLRLAHRGAGVRGHDPRALSAGGRADQQRRHRARTLAAAAAQCGRPRAALRRELPGRIPAHRTAAAEAARLSPNARIIFVSSRSQAPIDFDDVMLERGYSGGRGYAQSKLAQVMQAKELATRPENSTIRVYAVHPASQMDTRLVRGLGGRPRSTVQEGVDAVLHALSSSAPSGTYFLGEQVGTPLAQALDPEARRRLRALSDSLVRTRTPVGPGTPGRKARIRLPAAPATARPPTARTRPGSGCRACAGTPSAARGDARCG